MEQKTDRLHPSAPFENKNIVSEDWLEKQVNSLNNSVNNNKEMFTYFKDKTYISKKI